MQPSPKPEDASILVAANTNPEVAHTSRFHRGGGGGLGEPEALEDNQANHSEHTGANTHTHTHTFAFGVPRRKAECAKLVGMAWETSPPTDQWMPMAGT